MFCPKEVEHQFGKALRGDLRPCAPPSGAQADTFGQRVLERPRIAHRGKEV